MRGANKRRAPTAVFLGVIGYFQPRVLGIGYENITAIINGEMVGTALAVFVVAKLLAWSIYLGSGTSGGSCEKSSSHA